MNKGKADVRIAPALHNTLKYAFEPVGTACQLTRQRRKL